MPTITHKSINHPEIEKYVERNISDIEGEPFWVKVCFDPKTKNITVSYKKDDIYVDFVKLIYIDESRNGMIHYSYEDAILQDSDFRFTCTTFPEVVYHIIKEFYHEHNFHESENDSSLKPYVCHCSDDFKFKAPNNKALLHYLKCYEKVLQGMVAQSKMWMNILRKKDLSSNTKVFVAIPKLCLMARGYDAYLSTLYNSRYNTWCRLEHIPEQEEVTEGCERKIELRQIAFNIENSIKYFRALEYEFDLTYQQKNTEAVIKKVAVDAERNMNATLKSSTGSTRWAVYSIILSLIFSLGSAVYSARLSDQSSEELKAAKQSLDISIQELSEVMNGIEMQQDSIHKAVMENKTKKLQQK